MTRLPRSQDRPATEDLWAGRSPSAGLALLVGQLWPNRARDGIRLTLGPVPAGYRAVQQYAVMPNVESARMLIPADRRIVPAVLLAYNRLRSPRTRYLKLATAAGFRLGLGRFLTRDVLSVCVPAGVREKDLADRLLTAHLARELNSGPLISSVGVAAPAPNRKPTLQLFDQAGSPVAYLKVGWNDYTRGLVRHEGESLRSLAARFPGASPRRPAVLYAGEWQGLALLATAPLPVGIRGQNPEEWPDPAISRSVAGWAPHNTGPLAESGYPSRLRTELELARSGAELTAEEAGQVTRLLDRLVAEHGRAELELAAWHGDWSAWNLGEVDGESWVWDWEHFGTAVPLGFDLVHHDFQRGFVLDRDTVEAALLSAERDLPNGLRALGVSPDLAPVLVSLYLVEVLLRACRMKRLGAGWNDRFRAGAIAAVRSRV